MWLPRWLQPNRRADAQLQRLEAGSTAGGQRHELTIQDESARAHLWSERGKLWDSGRVVGVAGAEQSKPATLGVEQCSITIPLCRAPAYAEWHSASTRPTAVRPVEILRSSTHRGRRACLVVTHDVRLIDHADRILRIEDGRLVESCDQAASGPAHLAR